MNSVELNYSVLYPRKRNMGNWYLVHIFLFFCHPLWRRNIMHYGCIFLLAGKSSLIKTQSPSFPSRQKYKRASLLNVNFQWMYWWKHKLVAQIWKEKNRFDHLKGARISLSSTKRGQITLTLADQFMNPEMPWNMDNFISSRLGLWSRSAM